MIVNGEQRKFEGTVRLTDLQPGHSYGVRTLYRSTSDVSVEDAVVEPNMDTKPMGFVFSTQMDEGTVCVVKSEIRPYLPGVVSVSFCLMNSCIFFQSARKQLKEVSVFTTKSHHMVFVRDSAKTLN